MRQVLVTNIQKYSIHDGTGIRTTVFFKGCPLSCKWCHNPETQSYKKEILVYKERCVECGACRKVCPVYGTDSGINEKTKWKLTAERANRNVAQDPGPEKGEEDFEENMTAENCNERIGGNTDGENIQKEQGQRNAGCRKECIGCGNCIDECFYNARELCGTEWPVENLIKEVLKDQAFYETSGGGVTLSGGEVLAQDMDYIETLVKRLHNRGIPIFIDTCGAVPRHAFERILPYTDTFLFDIKLMDETLHRQYTGSSNRQILENLKWISNKHASIWIRIPVIGSVNDTEEEIEKIGTFLKENHISYKQIHLLPYHNTGSGKYEHLHMEYEGQEFYVPDQEKMKNLKKVLEMQGHQPVYIGG